MKTRSKTRADNENLIQHCYLDAKKKLMPVVSRRLVSEAETEAQIVDLKPQKMKIIEIGDNTDIKKLADTLAMEPTQSRFYIQFQKPALSVLHSAEQYWSVLLAVSYCHSGDKEIVIEHSKQFNSMLPNWNFIKQPKYKRYKKVQNSGQINLNFKTPLFDDFGMFQKAPDWNELSTKFKRLTTTLTLAFDIDNVSQIKAECLRLNVEWEMMESAFSWSRKWRPIGSEWAHFPNCDKLELFFDAPNDRELRDLHINLLEVVEHPELHVVLGKPIQVRDGYTKRIINNPKELMRDDGCHEDYWLKRDVEHFAQRMALSSVKTLKCMQEDDTTITFNCDEDFSYKLMKFLDTQPIYRGNEWESFLTLKEAKKSFRKKTRVH